MHLIFIIVLLVTSVLALTFIVERGFALRWNRVIPPAIQNGVAFYKSADDLPRLRAVCEENSSALGRLLIFLSEHLDWSIPFVHVNFFGRSCR